MTKAQPKPQPEVMSLCRTCLMAELRVAASGISTGVWTKATLSKLTIIGVPCIRCDRRAKHQLTLTI